MEQKDSDNIDEYAVLKQSLDWISLKFAKDFNLSGKIYEEMAPLILLENVPAEEKVQIIKENLRRDSNNDIFLNKYFDAMNSQYGREIKEVISKLDQMGFYGDKKSTELETDLHTTDDEKKRLERKESQNKKQENSHSTDHEARNQIEIDGIMKLKAKYLHLFEKANPGQIRIMGEGTLDDLSPDTTYEMVMEVGMNIFNQLDKKISQILHYIIFAELTGKLHDNMVFVLLTGGKRGEFDHFVQSFNNMWADIQTINNLPRYYNDHVHRLLMLQKKLREKKFKFRFMCIYIPSLLRIENITSIKKSLSSSQEIIQSLKSQYNEAEEAIESLKQAYESSEEQKNQLNTKVERLENDLKEKDDEIRKLKELLAAQKS